MRPLSISCSISNGIPIFLLRQRQATGHHAHICAPFWLHLPWGSAQCLAQADQLTGRITDGPKQLFRCHEASIEARRTSARKSRWRNYELIRHLDAGPMAELLMAGISAARMYKTTHLRWFTGGDCFSPALRDAIIQCSTATPELIHYLYTKNLWIWVESAENPSRPMPLPPNLRVTASWGGKFDGLIDAAGFRRTARVVHYRWMAVANGWPIDTSDRYAWQDEPTHFCHLTHGGQPKGSPAGAAISHRRKTGDFTGYGGRRRGATAAA
jgi:hypothetical protein